MRFAVGDCVGRHDGKRWRRIDAHGPEIEERAGSGVAENDALEAGFGAVERNVAADGTNCVKFDRRENGGEIEAVRRAFGIVLECGDGAEKFEDTA